MDSALEEVERRSRANRGERGGALRSRMYVVVKVKCMAELVQNINRATVVESCS